MLSEKRGLCVGGLPYRGRSGGGPKYFSIAAAPSFPACTASTTSLPPFTASPPAKTPLILVAQLAIVIFPLVFIIPLSIINRSNGICPAALITISTSNANVSPVSTGLLLPLASGSPNFITLQIISVTLLLLPFNSFGAANQII